MQSLSITITTGQSSSRVQFRFSNQLLRFIRCTHTHATPRQLLAAAAAVLWQRRGCVHVSVEPVRACTDFPWSVAAAAAAWRALQRNTTVRGRNYCFLRKNTAVFKNSVTTVEAFWERGKEMSSYLYGS